MAKGREWTKEERERIVQSLKPYLEMGFSRNKSCEFVGLAPATLSNWISEDDSLGILITSYENVVNTVAMQNIVDAINREAELQEDIRKENSWKWAERRMKADFSPRTELTGEEGKDIVNPETQNQVNQALIQYLNGLNKDTNGGE